MKKKHTSYFSLARLIWLAVLGFVLLNAFLFFFPLHKEVIYTNKERAEEYIYSKQNYSVVFVGSGLIGDFSPASVKRKNYFNLFFPYSGSCTGVEVVASSDKIPDTLFVETNYLHKGFDQQLVGELLRPGIYQARFLLPSLQQKHQLTSLLKENIISAKPRQIKTERYPEPSYSQSIAKYRKDYSELPDSIKLHQDLTKLKSYLQHLSRKGCKIILFEMPVDRSLLDYPKIRFERRAIRRTFEGQKMRWIAPDTLNSYATDDGVHLLEKGVYQYLAYLNHVVRSSQALVIK